MKITLYMAMSVNGCIAKDTDETPWSDEEWEAYKEEVERVGAIIIGSRTYSIMSKGGEFNRIGNPFVVVITSKPTPSTDTVAFVSTPQEALEVVKEKGFTEVLINGGAIINGLFIGQRLVDEVVVDVEPHLLGKGIPLFAPEEIDLTLQLLTTKQYSENGLQLRYKVDK